MHFHEPGKFHSIDRLSEASVGVADQQATPRTRDATQGRIALSRQRNPAPRLPCTQWLRSFFVSDEREGVRASVL